MTESDKAGRGNPTATVEDVANHYDVSERTVRRWLANTDIPHRRVGRVIRFDLDEVDEWAAKSGTAA